MSTNWNWPGSRWWKCDFHLHSSASLDFKGTSDPANWASAAVARGLHAVAVTDHNSPHGIATIKQAIADTGSELALFPGVEITVTPGLHLLALFDPNETDSTVTTLLGACRIPSSDFGKDHAFSPCSVTDALAHIAERNGVCIAAHVDEPKGLLKAMDPGQPLMKVVRSDQLGAAECNLPKTSLLEFLSNRKSGYERKLGPLAICTFSDAHMEPEIGRRFTWLKMTTLCIEGLRLSLQDSDLCVRAGDLTDPNSIPALTIESIEISDSKHLGLPTPMLMSFNPWLNAIIGGRGTGKSSIIEFLRLVLDRRNEIPPSLQAGFDDFAQIPRTRQEPGVLRAATSATVVIRKDGVRYRIIWPFGPGSSIEVEDADGGWRESPGDIGGRFPARIFGQKQIFELSKDPGALMHLVDESRDVNIAFWRERWRQKEAAYLSCRAHAREIQAGLADEARLRGELADTLRKLEIYEKSDGAATLQEYQLYQRQTAALQIWEEGLQDFLASQRKVASSSDEPTLPSELFRSEYPDSLDVAGAAAEVLAKVRDLKNDLALAVNRVDAALGTFNDKLRDSAWQRGVNGSQEKYRILADHLTKEGAFEYDRFVKRREEFERIIVGFQQQRQLLDETNLESAKLLDELAALRRELTNSREAFLAKTLAGNEFVQIRVEPFGDRTGAEAQFREIIGKPQGFEKDIGSDDGMGLIDQLYRPGDGLSSGEVSASSADDFALLLRRCKDNVSAILADPARARDRRFATHVTGLAPEAHDRLASWFPADSLRVSYGNGASGGFRPIDQGSAGQKTAALLAFILSYGEEPIVLDQPEDDLDSTLIYQLIVEQLRTIKSKRQVIVATHNPNIVVNGDAELVISLRFSAGQTRVAVVGGLEETAVREDICGVMEGGREAFERRYRRIGLRMPSE